MYTVVYSVSFSAFISGNPIGLSQQYVPVHTQYPPPKGSTTSDSQYPYKGYIAPRGPLPAQYTPPPGVSSSYQQVPKWKETKASYGYNPPVNSQSRDPYVAPAVQYQSPGNQQTVENSYPAGRQEEANGQVYKPYTATIKDSYGYRTYDRSNPNTQQHGDVQTPVPYYMNRFSNQADRMSYGYRQGESVTTSNDNWKPVSYYSREELLDAYAQRASREEASQDVHHTGTHINVSFISLIFSGSCDANVYSTCNKQFCRGSHQHFKSGQDYYYSRT